MAVLKPSNSAIISTASLALSGTETSSAIDLTKGCQLVFYVAATFNASATAGAELTLWPSYDGTNFVTASWQGWTWSIAYDTDPGAGSPILVASYPISPVAKSLKVKLENKDGSYAMTDVAVYYNLQTAG